MKISDLQKILAKVKREHGDIEVCYDLHSDTTTMNASQVDAYQMVAKLHGGEGWLTHYSDTMSDEQKARAKWYLKFPGN